MRSLFMTFVACAAFMVFSGSASATGMWTAEGVRFMTPINSSNVTVIPVNITGFGTLELCEQYLTSGDAMPLGSFKGYAWSGKLVAECHKTKE